MKMVREIFVKSVLNKHKRRDEWFLDDYSLNPYQLCEFGCVYCYIHGSKYEGTKSLAVKVNAPLILQRELRKRAERKEYGFIALGSATEPWQPMEKRYQVTRRCLEVIAKFRFPVHCLTKSGLILRDLDLLREIDSRAVLPGDLKELRGVLVTFSFSSLNEKVAKIFEPKAPSPEKRLEALWRVKEEGFYAGIAYIPVLPFISDPDEQLEEMIKAAKEFSADYVFVGALTLYGSGKTAYYTILERHFPELLPKYKELFKFNQPNWEYQRRLEKKARELCKKYNVKYRIV